MYNISYVYVHKTHSLIIWILSGFLIECDTGHHHDHKHDSAVSSVSIVSEGTLDLDEVISLFLRNHCSILFGPFNAPMKLENPFSNFKCTLSSLMIGLKGWWRKKGTIYIEWKVSCQWMILSHAMYFRFYLNSKIHCVYLLIFAPE